MLSARLHQKIAWARNAPADRKSARLALDCLDLTSLKGDESNQDIWDLCDVAAANRLASICIYPDYVATAAQALKNRPEQVRIATVINFPHGDKRTLSAAAATPETTAEDVSKAIAAGATQIDVVLDYKSFQSGLAYKAEDLLRAAREACGETPMKVILETASFKSHEHLERAAHLAVDCGADCLKTSTGKHTDGGATLEAAAILMHVAYNARDPVGCKISGGVKTTKDCAEYITLARSIGGWDAIRPDNFRFGASSILTELINTLRPAALPVQNLSQTPANDDLALY